jgi:acetoacetyl-CoA reductase
MRKKIALITDGAGALAQAVSAKLTDAGYGVAMTYSPSDKSANQWLANMRARGYDLQSFGWYPCDVTDEASFKYCLSAVTRDRGAIDVLVNNTHVTRETTFDWSTLLHTSVLNMTKEACDAMAGRGWGRVINVSWLNGLALAQANYIGAQSAIQQFTKLLALAVAQTGVTVNTILSGYPTANMGSLTKELLDVRSLPQFSPAGLRPMDEVAALVAYLCSEAGASLTGTNIAIAEARQVH